MKSYTREVMTEFRNAWTRFDKSTAYGCSIRNETFDPDLCILTWELYRLVYKKYKISLPIL